MRNSTSPFPPTDRKVSETSRTVDTPVQLEPEKQRAYGTNEEAQKLPIISSTVDDVAESQSSPLLQHKMDTDVQDAVEHINHAPLQQKSGSQAEPTEAAGWPLTQEPAVTNAVHDYRDNLQKPMVAPETSHHPLESLSIQHSSRNDVAAEPHEVEAIYGTMNHGVEVPKTQEDEISQGEVTSNRSSTKALSSTNRETAELLDENTAPPNEVEYQDEYHKSPSPHSTEPDATQGSFIAADDIPSPEHQLPAHHPQQPMVATEAQSVPFHYHELSDVEEASPVSSPREKHSEDEDAYSHVSEASGPRPFSEHPDPSGYVSDNADAPDTDLSHRGESYIKEDEVSESERSQSDVPKDMRAEPEAVTHAVEGQGQGGTATEEGFEENLPRLHPLQTPEITAEPTVQKTGQESEKAAEQEKDDIPASGEEQPAISEQEAMADSPGSEGELEREHGEAEEPETGMYDALGLQQSAHVVPTPEVLGPSQDDTSPLLGHEISPGLDDHEPEHDYEEAPVLKESKAVNSESPVDNMYKGYKRSSPEPYYIKPQTSEFERREGESGGDAAHQPSGYRVHSDDDTDTESQRFVTPLPSQNSLRAYYQQETTPQNVATDDYIGAHYYGEEDPRQYELEHQHTTTVHGEDNLFDDTDQSDAPAADDEAETVTTSQPGTPVVPEHAEQTEGVQANHDAETRRIPQVTVQSPTSPENPARKSWIEAVDSYFEEDEPRSQPETPPPHGHGLAEDQATSNIFQGDLPPESPVSTGSGLYTSQHNAERPQTPTGHESLLSSVEATPEESTSRVRDVTNTGYHVDEGWTPQSVRTRTPFSSPPGSPLHRVSSHKPHEPVTSRNPATEPPALHEQRYDSYEAFGDEYRTPVNFTTPWQGRQSPDLSFDPQLHTTNRHSTTSEGGATNTGGGSIFKRMRSIFEPGRSGSVSGPHPSPTQTSTHPQHHYHNSYPTPRPSQTQPQPQTQTHNHPTRSSTGTWSAHQPPTHPLSATTTTANETYNETSNEPAPAAEPAPFPFPPRGARFSPTRTRFSPLPSPTRPTTLPPDPGSN